MATITARDISAPVHSGPALTPTEQGNTNSGVANPPEGQTPPTAKPAEDPLSPKLAQLAKQQAWLRQQQLKTQDERKALEADRKAIEDAKSWKTRLTQDPYGVMLESGLTADQVATLMLQQPNVHDQKISLLEQQLKAAQAKIDQLAEGTQNAEKANLESARKQIFTDVKRLVESNPEIEAIKARGDEGYQAVVGLIEAVYNKEGTIMDAEEAINLVEEEYINEFSKYAALKKIQAKVNPPPAAPEKTQAAAPKSNSITISNRMVQTKTSGKLTDHQRRANAIAVGEGKPKPYI